MGACGKMGKVIADCVSKRDNCKIVAGVDPVGEKHSDFPVYNTYKDIDEKIDVIIDFSHPSALEDMLNFATDKIIPTVIATTGLEKEHIDKINNDNSRNISKTQLFCRFNGCFSVNLLECCINLFIAVIFSRIYVNYS